MYPSNLEMFMKPDQDKAAQELKTYEYNMLNALDHTANAEFMKAAAYHRNIANALEGLAVLRNNKVMRDQAKEMLKDMDPEELKGKWFDAKA